MLHQEGPLMDFHKLSLSKIIATPILACAAACRKEPRLSVGGSPSRKS